MTKYAMIFGGGNGVSYFLPLLRHGTLDEAIEAALDHIDSGEDISDDGDTQFEIIEITNSNKYTTANYQDFFEKRLERRREFQQKQEERNEREHFERLKKKFGK